MSTSERKIKKAFNNTIEEILKSGFNETFRNEKMFLAQYSRFDGCEDYGLEIEIHETI